MGESTGTDYRIEKLNSENYQIWKCKLELLLTSDDLWDVIGEDTPSEPSVIWKKKDARARAKLVYLWKMINSST